MIEICTKYLDLGRISNSGQCFRWNSLGNDRYSFVTNGKVYESYCKNGKVVFSNTSEDSLDYLNKYFDMQTDYDFIIKVSPQDDAYLQAAIRKFGGVRILNQDLWETMVSFIISQRKSIPAIRSCVETICERFGNRIQDERYSFPDAEVLSNVSLDDLRKCSVGYRDAYIKSAAEWFLENKDKAITYEMLLEIPGIGKKVSNCISLFALHDLSCCPIDVWMQRIIDTRYNGKYPEWMESQYAGVYQQYAFMYERYLSEK